MNNRPWYRRIFCQRILIFTLFSVVSLVTFFSCISFASPSQGAFTASTKGMASAAANVKAEDPSAMFFNPATLTQLHHTMLTFGVAMLKIKLPFTNLGSTAAGGVPVTGDGGQRIPLIFLPNIYYMFNYSPRLKFAIALSIPYGGFGVNHGPGWFGRYFIEDGLLAIGDLQPTIAYQFTKLVSFGASIDLQMGQFKKVQVLNFGFLTGGAPGSQTNDGSFRFKGQSFAVGFKLGMTFDVANGTIIGLSYHSPTTHRFRGNMFFFNVPSGGVALFPGAFVNTKAKTVFNFAPVIDLGIWQQLSNRWALAADITFEQWDVMQFLKISFDNPAQPAIFVPLRWRNIFRFALGTQFKATDWLTLRGGAAYDPTPVREGFRTADSPEEDLIILALGARLKVSKTFDLDVAFQHRFATDKGGIDASSSTQGRLLALVDARANAVMISGTWKL